MGSARTTNVPDDSFRRCVRLVRYERVGEELTRGIGLVNTRDRDKLGRVSGASASHLDLSAAGEELDPRVLNG